jgi:hypothetical protein
MIDIERQAHSNNRPIERDNLFTTFADLAILRIDEVMREQNCTVRPTPQQLALLRCLRPRLGLQNALPASDLCILVGVTPRELKELVQDLRLNFGVQIGASRDAASGGYYIISSEQESIAATAPMIHQAVAMLRVVKVMRKLQDTAELMGQIALQLKEAEAQDNG